MLASSAASSNGLSPWMLCPASANTTTRASGRRRVQFFHVGIVDDGRERAARERERHLAPLDCIPQRVEAWDDAAVVALAAAAPRQVVAPAPAPVGILDRVVHDPASQRRLGARGVEHDRALQDLVERLEVLGTVDEVRDLRRLLAVHARRDVDEHEFSDEIGRAVGERDRGQTAERHADEQRTVGRKLPHRSFDRDRVLARASTRDRRDVTNGRARVGRSRRADGRARARPCPTCARSARRRAAARARAHPRPSAAR